MIYYQLTDTVEPKIVGVTDGAGQAHTQVGDFLARNQWYKSIFHDTELAGKDWWKPWANITQYAQPLHGVFMEKKAKHTDYIGFLPRGFVVNNKLREILENSHLPKNHKFLETTFIQNEKNVDGYWWFVYDMESGKHTVDFSKCEYDLNYHKQKFGEDFTVEADSSNKCNTLVI